MRRRVLIPAVVGAAALVLGLAAPANAASPTVAFWPMDDTGSSMVDASGNGHTGALHAVTTGRRGYKGTAFGFSGTSSYVRVPDSTSLNPGTADFSFTVHVKFSHRPAGDYDVLRKGLSTTSGGDYKVEILSAGNAYCYFKGSSGAGSVSRSTNLADGSWHTITCARTSSSVTITVDGASTSKRATTGSIKNTDALLLGSKDGRGGDQYDGLLDHVHLYKG